MLDHIEDEAGPVMADRTRAYLHKALSWYSERDDHFNLTAAFVRVKPRARPKERARTRVLSDEEIRDSFDPPLSQPVLEAVWAEYERSRADIDRAIQEKAGA